MARFIRGKGSRGWRVKVDPVCHVNNNSLLTFYSAGALLFVLRSWIIHAVKLAISVTFAELCSVCQLLAGLLLGC